jgi:molybdopterin/thiamine biosynthesis adenylyltransferase
MGIEAVAKQAEARIMICGLSPLGIEIAKNIVLAGCKELLLFDDSFADSEKLSGQFFLSEKDTKSNENIGSLSKDKL